jgi:hypothetical protein
MKLFFLLMLCLVVAACGTPQEQCIQSVTRDLRVVDKLIAQSEANLARGYAMEEVIVRRSRWVWCAPPPPPPSAPDANPPPRRMCFEPYEVTELRPKAIDLDAERRMLASLRVKRAELARRAQAGVADCKARYPE